MQWTEISVTFECSSDEITKSKLLSMLHGRVVADKYKTKGIFRRDLPKLYEGLGLGRVANGGRYSGPFVHKKHFKAWKTSTHLIYQHTDNVYYFLRINK